jgi:8-oxo-dGTP diphosphatase
MGVTVIVDGANVMGSRADGWWRDRAGAMARLHGELAALATYGIPGPMPGAVLGEKSAPGEPDPGEADPGEADPGEAGGSGAGAVADWWFPDIVLVVEGQARAVLGLVTDEPRLRVVAARGEGDDEIASLAGQLPGQRIVVTADRELRRRCEEAGAVVTGPRWLTRLLT